MLRSKTDIEPISSVGELDRNRPTHAANDGLQPDLKAAARRVGARLRMQANAVVLDFDRPPPNAWPEDQRRQFIALIEAAAVQPGVRAIVLHGSRLFVETYKERNPALDPAFHDVLGAVARCAVPVAAAIVGDAVGSGLELALACAARVAGPRASFSLPAVHAGRIPVNGAVEQLPKLIGMSAATRMLVFGAWISAGEALKLGLIDRTETDGLTGAAAKAAIAAGPRDGCAGRRSAQDAAALSKAHVQLLRQAPGQTAPHAVLKAMESAQSLPVRRSMVETQRLDTALRDTEQGRALAYAEAGVATLRAAIADELFDLGDLLKKARWPFLREVIHLVDEGASPAQVDRVVTRYGVPDGPFARSDRLGLNMLFPRDLPWLSYSPTLDLMADAGRDGGQAAPGWFRRPADNVAPDVGVPLPVDSEVEQLLRASATFQRLIRKPMNDEAVLERCLHAAINGAALVLEEIGVQHAPLIDALCVALTGFPRWKGGPLYQSERIGQAAVTDSLRAMHARRNTAGPPSALLGRGFRVTR